MSDLIAVTFAVRPRERAIIAEAAGPMLLRDPVANTLMLGALAVLETGSLYGDGPNEFAWVSDGDRVVAAFEKLIGPTKLARRCLDEHIQQLSRRCWDELTAQPR